MGVYISLVNLSILMIRVITDTKILFKPDNLRKFKRHASWIYQGYTKRCNEGLCFDYYRKTLRHITTRNQQCKTTAFVLFSCRIFQSRVEVRLHLQQEIPIQKQVHWRWQNWRIEPAAYKPNWWYILESVYTLHNGQLPDRIVRSTSTILYYEIRIWRGF